MFAGHRVTDGKIWLSRDPSGESSDENLYRLYGGDPINLNDTSGLNATTAAEADAYRRSLFALTGVPALGPTPIITSDGPGISASHSPILPPPTGTQIIVQHAKETVNGGLDTLLALPNTVITGVNNVHYDWTTHYQDPYHIRIDQSGVSQIPLLRPGFKMDYNADPDADYHVQRAGLVFQLGTVFLPALGAPAVPDEPVLVPDGTGNVILGTAASDPVITATGRFTPTRLAVATWRKGMVIVPFARSANAAQAVDEALANGELSVRTPGQIGLPNNPWGAAGDVAHQATIARLEAMAATEFPGAIIRLGEPLPSGLGLSRMPDVWAQDPATLQVLKVYEAARFRNGALVSREFLKQQQYKAAGIPAHFEEVK
jgi:hypothetical protein